MTPSVPLPDVSATPSAESLLQAIELCSRTKFDGYWGAADFILQKACELDASRQPNTQRGASEADTLMALVVKWRAACDSLPDTNYDDGKWHALDLCADELEAALNTARQQK